MSIYRNKYMVKFYQSHWLAQIPVITHVKVCSKSICVLHIILLLQQTKVFITLKVHCSDFILYYRQRILFLLRYLCKAPFQSLSIQYHYKHLGIAFFHAKTYLLRSTVEALHCENWYILVILLVSILKVSIQQRLFLDKLDFTTEWFCHNKMEFVSCLDT